MKSFAANSAGTSQRLTLPIQFLRFGVDDQEIVIPIRRRNKKIATKAVVPDKPAESQSKATEGMS